MEDGRKLFIGVEADKRFGHTAAAPCCAARMIRKEIGDYIICPLFVPAQRETDLSNEGITMSILGNGWDFSLYAKKIRESRVTTLPMKTVDVSLQGSGCAIGGREMSKLQQRGVDSRVINH